MSPQDLELLKSSNVKLQQFCRLYGVDSKLFNDPKGSTYNNLPEATKQMYTDNIIPNNNKLVDGYNRFIVPGWSKADGKQYRVRQDLSQVEALQSDKKKEAEKNAVKTKTITDVLSAPISDEAKISTLVIGGGINQEEAEILVPKKEEDGTGTSSNTGGNVQVQSLNGAQVASMTAIAASVSSGELPKPSAIAMLIASFGMTQGAAEAIINPITINAGSNE